MTPSSPKKPQLAPLKPTEWLRDCPPWPTMQWLPHEPLAMLRKCLKNLDDSGFPTTRVELICALILECDPGDVSLVEDIRAYKARYRQTRPPRELPRGVPLMLRMRSPITLRLDLLTGYISERSLRVYRHELIGTLLTRAGKDIPRLEEVCLAYRKARAGQAAVQGLPPGRVLTQERPRPGARSI
jgi:hypothetical protein